MLSVLKWLMDRDCDEHGDVRQEVDGKRGDEGDMQRERGR